jgi:hypothetical protein
MVIYPKQEMMYVPFLSELSSSLCDVFISPSGYVFNK